MIAYRFCFQYQYNANMMDHSQIKNSNDNNNNALHNILISFDLYKLGGIITIYQI